MVTHRITVVDSCLWFAGLDVTLCETIFVSLLVFVEGSRNTIRKNLDLLESGFIKNVGLLQKTSVPKTFDGRLVKKRSREFGAPETSDIMSMSPTEKQPKRGLRGSIRMGFLWTFQTLEHSCFLSRTLLWSMLKLVALGDKSKYLAGQYGPASLHSSSSLSPSPSWLH